jgi:hypothetical protein
VVFKVSGPSGTTGSAYICVPKSLIEDIYDIQVFLDKTLLYYNVESIGDAWLVTFTYHHSTHQVTMNLNEAMSTTLNKSNLTQFITYGVVASLATAAVIFFVKKERAES